MKVLVILLTVVTATQAQVEPFGTEICRLFADDVKLRLPGSCQEYVTCQNGESIVSDCGSGKFYNKDTKACASSTSDAYCKDPCTSKSPIWVADPQSCSGYYRCKETGGEFSTCPGELHFNEKQQACIFADESPCKGYDYCDVVPNDVPFKDDSTCNKYFVCEKAKLKSYTCESQYYHPQLGCTKKANVECAVHPFPEEICGTAKKPIRNKFVNDQRTCRGYYYCDDKGDNIPDLNPRWGQCPSEYFFHFDRQACVSAADVPCEEDRCDGRTHEQAISATLGCQHYLICNNDLTVSEEQCPSGMYFDDTYMVCTAAVRAYAACS